MNTRPVLIRPHVGTTIVAAALSVVIATLLLLGVVELFVRDGFPLQNVVIAEAVCGEHSRGSERDACVQSLLAGSYHRHVASR